MPARGPEDSPAAMFLYRADGRQQTAWDTAEDVQRRDHESGNRVLVEQGGAPSRTPFLRIEQHERKERFLSALAAWSRSGRQFVLIYAHGGARQEGVVGIIPGGDSKLDQLISWQELAEALGEGVDCLWLVGCRCLDAAKYWEDRPVRSWMLSCSTERDFLRLVDQFGVEISVETVLPPSAVLHAIQSTLPELADSIEMLQRENGAWSPVRPKPPPPPLTELELQSLRDLFRYVTEAETPDEG